MKKIIGIAICFIATITASAQQSNWKEMHGFHSVMSAAFHPAEDNNLQPVKDSASALVAKAKTWKASTVPPGYNGTVTKPILKRLVAECAAIETAVKLKKPDSHLRAMITKAHDTFHEIMEKCRTEKINKL